MEKYLDLNPNDTITVELTLGEMAMIYAVMGNVIHNTDKKTLWAKADKIFTDGNDAKFLQKYWKNKHLLESIKSGEEIDYEKIRNEWEAIWFPKVKSAWYDNIPKDGVMCWVWDSDDGHGRYYTAIIKGFNAKFDYRFEDSSECRWEFAEPMSREETEKFLLVK